MSIVIFITGMSYKVLHALLYRFLLYVGHTVVENSSIQYEYAFLKLALACFFAVQLHKTGVGTPTPLCYQQVENIRVIYLLSHVASLLYLRLVT